MLTGYLIIMNPWSMICTSDIHINYG